MRLLETRAKGGDRDAQYQLASLYRAGRGMETNDTAAFKWMQAAARQGHVKAQYSLGAMYLSGRGSAVDVDTGKSWLQKAAAQGHEQAIRLLAEAANTHKSPAKPATKTEASRISATASQNTAPLPPLDPNIVSNTDASRAASAMPPFVEAAWRGQIKTVQRFLDAHVDLEQKDRAGNTALSMAAAGGHLPVIEALLQAGAKADSANANAETPLMHAVNKGKADAATRLIAAKVNLNARTTKGASALDLAVKICNAPVTTILLRAGAIAAASPNGETPLMRAAARCEGLIRNLLGVVHIESGRLTLERSWFDVGELVRAVCRDYGPAAAAVGAPLTWVVGDLPLTFLGDRDRLYQVLANLIGNALSHARGAAIEVSVVDRGDWLVLAVVDQGPGIQLAGQAHVFDRFRQGGHTRRGAGLGLAIVKGLVAAHQGVVSMSSVPGQGARFEVALPRGLQPPAAPPV
ncbi:MAG: ATP-binding protein [Hyphomicrobium sp.]